MFKFLLASLIGLFSLNVSAVEICQLMASGNTYVNGQAEPPARGKVLASINSARLPAGQTCDSWRVNKEKEIAVGGCVLLSDGNQTFEGFGDKPPKRGTEISRGLPKQGQTCDAWRDEQASKLLIG